MAITRSTGDGAARAPLPSAGGRIPWLALSSAYITCFMTALSISSVNVALPRIAEDFGLTTVQAQWVVTTYFLASVGLMLTAGSLADRLGRRRYYLLGTLVFGVGALASGLAPSLPIMVAMRFIHGTGSALILATNVAIILEIVPPEHRGKVLGVTGSITMVGSSLGPGIAGLLLTWLGWQSVFWVNVPMALAAFLLGWRMVPLDQAVAPTSRRFDLSGAVLYLASMTALVWGLSHTSDPSGPYWLVGALVLLAAFVAVELKHRTPMLNLGLLKKRVYALGIFGQWLTSMAVAGPQFVLPFFLVQTAGRSNMETGLIMMVLAAGSSAGAPVGGWLTDRFRSFLITGSAMILSAVGYLWLLQLPRSRSPVDAIIALSIIGLGAGIFMVPNRVSVNDGLLPSQLSVGNAIYNTARHMGRLVGVSLAATLSSGPGGAFSALPPLVMSLLFTVACIPTALMARPPGAPEQARG